MDKLSLNIRLDGMNVLEKVMTPFIPIENAVFAFDVKAQLMGTATKDMIAVVVSISIRYNDDPKVLARIITEFGFEIKDLNSVVSKGENDKMIIPSELEGFLKTISIGSMRGIMHSEFRGTNLHSAILPIIVMDSMKPVSGSVLGDDNTPAIAL